MMIAPAIMLMTARNIFQPIFVRSTARLPSENSPPTNQNAPMNVIRIIVVTAGVHSNIAPRAKRRIPNRRITHQG